MKYSIHTVNGVRTAIADSQPNGKTEAVVFVHGSPGPMDDWIKLIDAVSPFARTIAMDLPGFGRSDRPRDFDHSVPGHGAHLGEVINSLELEKVHLVLHDFGGPIGLEWAVKNTKKFSSVCLINTGILIDYSWHQFARIWQTPVFGELFMLLSTPAAIKRLLNKNNPKPLPQYFLDHITRFNDWKNKRAVLKLYRASTDTSVFADRTTIETFRQLNRPACVVWGECDPFLPVKNAPLQKAAFPSAQIHTFPALGHWPFIDDPELIENIMVPFLQEQFH